MNEDVLGPPYTTETLHLAPDEEGDVVATLVRRPADHGGGSRRAVLHVHGFADYFFQTGYADWWTARGYDFYALDLRKHGRSLRPHHTPNYVADLTTYHEELDRAWELVTARDGHDHVVGSGHSTGGLTAALWADALRHRELVGLVLNSPWFDLQGPAWMRTVGTRLLREVGRRQPRRVIPRTVSGLYARSLHRDHEGEHDFDLAWKPLASWPVHAGWLRAVREGHARLHGGLDVGCPALVLTSGRSSTPTVMCEDVHRTDIVLDVAHMRRWAHHLGPHVTLTSIEGARHDVTLSLPEPRARVYDALERWVAAYLDEAGRHDVEAAG